MAKPLITKASNVTDNTLQKHIRAISSLKTSLESAQGEYRSALKAAKADGVKTAQLIAALAAKKRDSDDVRSDLRDYVRYLGLLHMPVVQLDLFAAQEVAVADDDSDSDEPDDEHASWEADAGGFKAGSEGWNKESNPYPDDDARHDTWMAGWMRGQETLLPKGGVKKASTRRNRSGLSAH